MTVLDKKSFCENLMIWDIFNGSGSQKFDDYMSVAKEILAFSSKREDECVINIFNDFDVLLNIMSTKELADFGRSKYFCKDYFDFLNFRTAIILKGRDFFFKILSGDYSGLEGCRFMVAPMRKIFYEVIGGLDIWCLNSGKDGLRFLDDYSDEKFIRFFKPFAIDVLALQNKDNSSVNCDESIVHEGSTLSDIFLPSLGHIKTGDFLEHKKLGVFWIYRIYKNVPGQIHLDAMCKEQHRSLLLIEGSGLIGRLACPC